MRILIAIWILFLAPAISYGDPLQRIMDLRGQWKFSIGDNPRWAAETFDDSRWETIFVPAAWEDEGFSGFDGFAWYRKTFELPNTSENNLYLVLGYIDDVDEVYLNGKLIGFTGSFPPNFYTAFRSHRQYYLPPDLLNKDGENVIAVRVYDTILEGGIIKGNIGIYTKRSEPAKTYLLEGIWKFREGDNQWWRENNYNDESWDDIMVPGFWRSLKDKEMNAGTAWYRKTFEIPDYLKNEQDLVLVLGLIDDFDETYLNGQLIGSTNDGRGYGWSYSYMEYRVYSIPKDLLKKTGKNILSVRVRDIGGNAGIYSGPLGIIPRRDTDRLISSR